MGNSLLLCGASLKYALDFTSALWIFLLPPHVLETVDLCKALQFKVQVARSLIFSNKKKLQKEKSSRKIHSNEFNFRHPGFIPSLELNYTPDADLMPDTVIFTVSCDQSCDQDLSDIFMASCDQDISNKISTIFSASPILGTVPRP